MRLRAVMAGPVAVSVLLLTGCGCERGGTGATASAQPSPAVPWLLYNSGNPAPGPDPADQPEPVGHRPAVGPDGQRRQLCDRLAGRRRPGADPDDRDPGARSLTRQWPARYGPNYRVAAVDQKLVAGTQPPPTWVKVTRGRRLHGHPPR